TKAEMLGNVRAIAPNHFLLVPGVGAQGGSLEAVAQYGMNKDCGLLVNSSRGIIYADSTDKFAEVAAEKSKELQLQMADLMKQFMK
ncbi:MAG: orotidine 5'-phosphate decarboxylase, partial [Bacteroidales bacterium]|nr:orotidine 5'-phosphate decarboxylase [Bacteroidales bacterium]